MQTKFEVNLKHEKFWEKSWKLYHKHFLEKFVRDSEKLFVKTTSLIVLATAKYVTCRIYPTKKINAQIHFIKAAVQVSHSMKFCQKTVL